jgi:hypothetical protein
MMNSTRSVVVAAMTAAYLIWVKLACHSFLANFRGTRVPSRSARSAWLGIEVTGAGEFISNLYLFPGGRWKRFQRSFNFRGTGQAGGVPLMASTWPAR